MEWLIVTWPLWLLPIGFFFGCWPCCEGTATATVTFTGPTIACDQCDEAPEEWSLEVSGFANGLCDACEELDGSFVLRFSPSGGTCQWVSDETAAACSPCVAGAGGVRWRLVALSGNFRIEGRVLVDSGGVCNGVTVAVYTISAVDFDCLGSNTLNRSSTNVQCTGAPATLTVVPN